MFKWLVKISLSYRYNIYSRQIVKLHVVKKVKYNLNIYIILCFIFTVYILIILIILIYKDAHHTTTRELPIFYFLQSRIYFCIKQFRWKISRNSKTVKIIIFVTERHYCIRFTTSNKKLSTNKKTKTKCNCY